MKRMKVGLILECGPQGADKAVCEHFARLLDPEIEIVSLTLDDKPNLIENCADAAIGLLEFDGCDRVVIIWDLYPAWRKRGERPCRKQDRDQVLEKLDNAGVSNPNVFLVCIEEELEAWLLSEHQAISAVLSRPTREVRIRRERHPERVRNPKVRIRKYFDENGKIYDELVHAKQIAQNIANTNRLRRCRTFVRFALKVADIQI